MLELLRPDKDAALVRIPPPAIFLTGVGIAVGLQNYVWAIRIDLDSAVLLIVAGLIAIASITLLARALIAHVRSGQNPEPWKTTPSVLTQGVYRWSRNPMYVGMALAQGALGVWLANGWILALLPVTTGAVYYFAIRAEEIYLAAKFGSAYEAYTQQVRRWL